MNEAIEFYKKHGLGECKRAYALSLNAGFEDLEMRKVIDDVITLQLQDKYKTITPNCPCSIEKNLNNGETK